MNHKRKKINRIKVILSASVAVLLVLIALFASVIAPNDPYETCASAIRTAPSAEFLFGTDNLGRCVFSRVLYGARTTIAATFILVAISFILGSFIGVLS
jgi:peptide/nickel transport system permease protein